MNKKAQSIMDIFFLIAIIIVIVVFFAVWRYSMKTVNTTLRGIETPPNDLKLNISDATKNSFSYMTGALDGLKLLATLLIFGMLLTIVISNFFVKAHPVFFGVYIMIAIVSVILAMIISNAYNDMLGTSGILGDALSDFTAPNYILLYLPIWVTIICFVGAIFLFSGIIKDSGQGGGLG